MISESLTPPEDRPREWDAYIDPSTPEEEPPKYVLLCDGQIWGEPKPNIDALYTIVTDHSKEGDVVIGGLTGVLYRGPNGPLRADVNLDF